MRIIFRLSTILLLTYSLPAAAVDIEIAKYPIEIDGYLPEWGGVLPISLQPGGDGIGVRGAFAGTDDHEADAYAVWDAQFLYLAIAVTDDAVDIAKIHPDNQVWSGPNGERKDRMFYYDQLKLFVRDSSSSLGNNLWITPKQPDGAPYAWGHRQRSPADEHFPGDLAGELVEGTYTFEVALPWSWLEITPRTNTVFNIRILLVDADLPGVPIEEKIAEKTEKWIWWAGSFTLMGDLPNNSEALTAAAVFAEHQRRQQEARAVEQARVAALTRAQAAQVAQVESLAAMRKAAVDSIAAKGAQVRMATRQRRAKPAPAIVQGPAGPPEWLLAIPRSAQLTDDQVEEFAKFLHGNCLRLIRKRISSRIDYAVVDMAKAAGTQRALAREFMLNLLAAIDAQLAVPGGGAQPPVVAAAQRAHVAPDNGVTLVREIVAQARQALERSKLLTTGEAIDRAASKAALTSEQAHLLLESLLSGE